MKLETGIERKIVNTRAIPLEVTRFYDSRLEAISNYASVWDVSMEFDCFTFTALVFDDMQLTVKYIMSTDELSAELLTMNSIILLKSDDLDKLMRILDDLYEKRKERFLHRN